MTETDPNAVLKEFAEQVAEEFPDLRQILDEAKAGRLTESEALAALSEVLMSSPELGQRFQQLAMQALMPLQEEQQPDDHGGLMLHKKRGLPRLNPLVEAALIERAQFDGDIPELRTGGLPEGVKPAVSVDTDARNPVAMGRMLASASDQVAEKIEAAKPKHQQLIADAATLDLVGAAGTALAKQEDRELVLAGKSDLVDVPEYKRGQVPAPLRVVKPAGSELLALTPEERKQSAWQFLSTTQGRRSALSGLEQLIEARLKKVGLTVKARPFDPATKGIVLAAHEWRVSIDGPGATQAAFSLIDTASAAIAKMLGDKVGDREGLLHLEVTTIDTVDLRSVGWAGRLVSGDAALPASE